MAKIEIDKELIDRYFRGQNSDEDLTYINEVFCNNDTERELKRILSKQFDGLQPEDDQNKKNLDHILHWIHFEINTKSSTSKAKKFDGFIRWAWRIAGVLILPILVFAGIQTYQNSKKTSETWVEIKAPAWTRAHFSLPDGTTGWLNSNSSIKYLGRFNVDRQVSLNGEAYFNVIKDAKRPFKVNADDLNIKVLGTKFSIASYDNENTVEVVLEEGKLMVSDKQRNKSYTMKPNELAVYSKNLNSFSVQDVQARKYLSWTEGKLVFRNDPLEVISRRLERWYNVDIEVNVSSTEDIRWYATFTDDSLEEVLSLMKRSLPINYTIVNSSLNQDKTYNKKKVIITN